METTDGSLLFTDARYTEQARAELDAVGSDTTVIVTGPAERDDRLAEVLPSGDVGFDPDRMTVADHRRLAPLVEAAGVEFIGEGGLVASLRRRKDLAEIERLARAAAITDTVLLPLLGELTAPAGRHGRPNERVMARRLADAMLDLGAEDVSFDLIVAGGPNGARPHARPGSRVVEDGDLVVFDVGAKVEGYGSDMTRTIAVGGSAGPDETRWFDAVIEAQAAGVAAVGVEVDEIEIDRACREVLERHGLAEHFTHGTGHGLGLEIHEAPILSPRSVGILSAGLVITVEPGVYLPGRGGVRIEDSVVVTEDGAIPLTATPKGLAVG